MIVINPDKLARSRIQRMGKLIELRAPKDIIFAEAELLIRSAAGGSRWAVAWYMTKRAIRGSIDSYKFAFWYFYQRRILGLTDDQVDNMLDEEESK